MCAPTSVPFSRMQTLSSRPASLASCFRRIAAAGPPARRRRSPRHRAWTRVRSSSLAPWRRALASRRAATRSTRMPCQFLDRAVNGREKASVGGEVGSIGIAEARSALAWWLEAGVDVADPGGAPRSGCSLPAKDAPRPGRGADKLQNVVEAHARNAGSNFRTGWQAAFSFRLASTQPQSGSCRKGWKMQR